MINEFEMKKQLCEIGRRIYNLGFVAANDGNFSVKISDNEILCTPTGVSKGFMTPDMICKIDTKGNILSANGKYKPSSEIKMHLSVYKNRPDVKSVVHAHPPYATSYAIAGIPLTKPIMPEAVISLGEVPIAKYGMPSTTEIPDAVEPYLEYYDAVLLECHGALTYGEDLMTAYFKMESLEFYAKLHHLADQIGGPKEIPHNEVLRLYDLRKKMGLSGKHVADKYVADEGLKEASCTSEVKKDDIAALIEEVTRRTLAQLTK